MLLPEPLRPDDPEELARLDLEGDVPQRLEAVVPGPPHRVQHPLLERVHALVRQAEGLAHAVDNDGWLLWLTPGCHAEKR